MELPKDLSWEITTNENGIEMITMPKFKMNEIVEYLKYADTELKKLRVGDVVGRSEQLKAYADFLASTPHFQNYSNKDLAIDYLDSL